MGTCRIQVKTLPLEVIRVLCTGHDDVSYNTKTPVHTSLRLPVRAAHFDVVLRHLIVLTVADGLHSTYHEALN